MVIASLLLTTAVGCKSTQKAPPPAERDLASAAAHWEQLFSDRAIEHEFTTELVNELKSRVRTFPRPVRVYHYGGRAPGFLDAPRADTEIEIRSLVAMPTDILATQNVSIQPKPPLSASQYETGLIPYRTPLELNPEEAVTYFEKFSSLFRDGELESQVGPGIYAATDLIQSESYAKNPWFLMEIEVPAGSRYLDLRPIDGLVVSKDFIDKWFPKFRDENNSRIVQFSRIGDRFAIDWQSLLQVDALRKVIGRSLARLKVDALAYGWSEPKSELCQQITYELSTAFNFIEPSFAKRAKLRVFVENMGLDPTEMKTKEYRRIFDLVHSYPVRGDGFEPSGQPGKSVTDTHINLFPQSSKMRALTYAWISSLMTPYPLSEILQNPNDAELVYKSVAGVSNDGSQVYSSSVPSTFALNRDRMNCRSTDSHYTSCIYSPLEAMKKSDPKKAAAITAQYRRWTFGCSEKFPSENRTPDI